MIYMLYNFESEDMIHKIIEGASSIFEFDLHDRRFLPVPLLLPFQGSGVGVQSLGTGDQGLGFRVQGFGFRF